MAVVALKARRTVHRVAIRALRLTTVRSMRIGIHLRGAFGHGAVGLMAAQARFFARGLEVAAGVAGRAGEIGVRAVGLHGGSSLCAQSAREHGG